MDDKVIIVEPKDYEGRALAAARDYFLYGRPVLSVEQDLELAKQGVKIRKSVQYGHKVIVRRKNE